VETKEKTREAKKGGYMEYNTIFRYSRDSFNKAINDSADRGWRIIAIGANFWGYWALMHREFD
jgi:hypothetical protein